MFFRSLEIPTAVEGLSKPHRRPRALANPPGDTRTISLRAMLHPCHYETGNALRPSYIRLVFKGQSLCLAGYPVRKTIQILGISLGLLALLVFATGVVSDWHHQGANDDARCPYCHLGHQAPAQIVAVPAVLLLKPVASLPLPQDVVLASGPEFSLTSPRAPPSL